MLKSLYPRVDWSAVRIIGFDMDGTLYDEADFIAQVYRPIAGILAEAGNSGVDEVYAWLFRRWLEKGSSYNRIFGEALACQGISGDAAAEIVARCVEVFRHFSPALTLSPRVQTILTAMTERFPLFLVSDGSERLQRRKFDSLGLQRWFQPDNVAISGVYGADFAKPATRILREIALLKQNTSGDQVVFFGDRDVDAGFAANAGFQFVKVKCMHAVA